ncbi:MAG: NAD(P)/FAD-dependent oxidoreductase [Oscillospiraceae bacterium]|jgi:glycerol-3-phosphate dehydrogenase|nr:NAD(P)/FAD-dependent oxidoreductase [Oscillospiraceae bacterium]
MFDAAIIGCGITGAALAFELSRYKLKILILEKENDVSQGASKANSGIIHAGYDPMPGTKMAALNVEGARLAEELCQNLDVEYKKCGSLVLAFSAEEEKTLELLYNQGVENGVPELEIIRGEAIRKLEPNVSGKATAALYAPGAAVVIPWDYVLALAETAVQNGAELRLNAEVSAVEKTGGFYKIKCGNKKDEIEEIESRFVLNAAGVNSAEIHNMIAPPNFKITPNRGEYYLLDKAQAKIASRVIFQCPNEKGKGVLVSTTAHGNIIIGPDSSDVSDGENTATSLRGLAYVAETARKSVPSLDFRANIRNFSGVRANPDSGDFIIQEAEGAPGFIDLAGIKSPGLSAAPAIAKLAVSMLEQSGLALIKKENFIYTRRKIRFANLSEKDKQTLVRENPNYGRIICRCETVTEGEILDALRSPIIPRSIDAVKRRCGAGLGRCQGGFCSPRVTELISKELCINPLELEQDRSGSYIFTSETKGGGKDA